MAYQAMPVSAYKVNASGELRPDSAGYDANDGAHQEDRGRLRRASAGMPTMESRQATVPMLLGGRARHGAHRVAAGVSQALDAAEITQPPILQLRQGTQRAAQQRLRLGRDQARETAPRHHQALPDT